MKRHLCFTGFMGSGKTTIAKAISEKSNIPFIDLDTYIELNERKTISELFKEGEEIFREKESYYLKQVIQNPSNLVIALGGGTICFYDNLKIVLEHSWLIALLPPIDVLLERLWNNKNNRPLISHINTKEQLKEFIEKKQLERMPYYRQADWIVEI